MEAQSETWAAADGTVVTIRPISAADLSLEQEFVDGLSASTGYQRLMSARHPSLEELRRFTDIDPERELKLLRLDLDVGKHGDTGASESAVLNAVAGGQADAGAVGDPFWAKALEERAVDGDKVRLLWNTPPYHHCNFTALDSLEQTRVEPWVEALLRMDYNNPRHRPLLDMEGLKRWLPAQIAGYRTLFEAVEEQGI